MSFNHYYFIYLIPTCSTTLSSTCLRSCTLPQDWTAILPQDSALCRFILYPHQHVPDDHLVTDTGQAGLTQRPSHS